MLEKFHLWKLIWKYVESEWIQNSQVHHQSSKMGHEINASTSIDGGLKSLVVIYHGILLNFLKEDVLLFATERLLSEKVHTQKNNILLHDFFLISLKLLNSFQKQEGCYIILLWIDEELKGRCIKSQRRSTLCSLPQHV